MMKKKWDLRATMLRAWKIWRKGGVSFGEALHRAWNSEKAAPVNAQRIADAKAAAGITEETAAWSGWKAAGYEVIHGSKALFGVDLVHSSKGDGAVYKARFFGRHQVTGHCMRKAPYPARQSKGMGPIYSKKTHREKSRGDLEAVPIEEKVV